MLLLVTYCFRLLQNKCVSPFKTYCVAATLALKVDNFKHQIDGLQSLQACLLTCYIDQA